MIGLAFPEKKARTRHFIKNELADHRQQARFILFYFVTPDGKA